MSDKQWRPEGWEGIVRDNCYDGDVCYRELDTFEAGADAMLKKAESLIRQDEREKGAGIARDYFELSGSAFLAKYPIDEKAYWEGQDGEGLIQALKKPLEEKE